MEQYWTQYVDTGNTSTTANSVTYTGASHWIIDPYDGTSTYPWGGWIYYPYQYHQNKTEQAYEILKVLVKEEMIKEPKSFKKFCDLIEKIAKAI